MHRDATPVEGEPPTVSVVLPTFNRARLLRQAVGSVLRQSYGDFELIVVDDGSSDDTGAVVAAMGDARLRCLVQPHRGISSAMNAGVRAARGRYVARLDSDDLWAADLLSTLVPVLERDPGAAAAYGKGQAFDAAGRALPHLQGGPGRFPGETLRSLVFDDCTCNIALLARRACLEEVGLYDEELAANEDWDIWLRVARRGHRFVFVDRVLAYVRWHDGNLTGTRSSHFAEVLAARTRPLDKLFADPDLPAAIRAERSAAYANVYLFRGARWLEAGQPRRALRELWHSVRASDSPLTALLRIPWRIAVVPLLVRSAVGRRLAAIPSLLRRARAPSAVR
jgi:GT2 family glycosyltransferase